MSFGYQVLGFGSGGAAPFVGEIEYLLVAGGGAGGSFLCCRRWWRGWLSN